MAPPPSLESLCAAPAGATLPLDGERLLWRSDDGTRQDVLDAREWMVLEQCRGFHTRDQHLSLLASTTGLGPSRAGRIYDELRARGLLLTPAQRLAGADHAHTPLPDPLLCIRTCNRPHTLARLLDSLQRWEAGLGLQRQVLVIDDGTDADGNRATREAVDRFARARGGRVFLVGADQRPALRQWLRRASTATTESGLASLVDPEVPTGRGGARSWNVAVLASAGRALSLLDDDIVFDPRVPPGFDDGIELYDSIASETGWLGDDGAARLPAWPGDLIAALAVPVGRTPGALDPLARLDPRLLVGRTHADLDVLRPGSRILAAFTGVYGELAFDSSVFLNIGAPQRAPELLAEPFDPSRFEADRIWHGIRRTRLLTHAVYTPLLLDARGLLPFAGSWGKADDTLFLSLLTAMVRRPAYLYSPALLGHHPPERRNRLANSLKPLLIDRSAIVAGLVDSYATALRGDDRCLRLRAVGAYCAELATAAERELADLVARAMQTQYANLVDTLQRTIGEARSGVPAAWIEHVGTIVRVQRAALADPPEVAEAVPVVRAALAQIGAAAPVWPTLWEHALEHPLLTEVACAIG